MLEKIKVDMWLIDENTLRRIGILLEDLLHYCCTDYEEVRQLLNIFEGKVETHE